MSKLHELVKKRGSYKGRLTKFENYVSSLKSVSDCSQVDKLELKLRMNKIETIYNEFDEVQTSIECLSLSEEEQQNQSLQRSEFETQYFSVMARAQQLCDAFKRKERSFNHGDNASVCSDSSSSDQESVVKVKQTKSVVRGVKLPTINIPKYSGDCGNWLEFRDTFISLIHDNSSISNIQKFHYLRASLEGSAAQIICSLEFSASNYCLAWNALCERYDNTRLLVQNHIKAIFEHESIKKESASSLRVLIDMYNKNLRALQILGEPTGTWDTLIIYIICQKLDSRTLRDWEEHKATHKQVNLEIFSKFLKNKADLLETIENNNNKPETTSRSHTTRNVKSLASVANPTPKIFKCPLDQGEHPLYKCDSFIRMKVPEREQFVKTNRLCRNCFRLGHTERLCRLGPCRQCTLKHNSLLHPNSAPEISTPPAAAISLSSSCCQPGEVLLATAIIKIRDANNVYHDVKAVLDSGSQASFISEHLLNKLKLNFDNIKFKVSGINNLVSTITKRCQAVIQSRLNSYQTKVSFLVLPDISSSLRKSLKPNLYNIPPEIKLADPEFYNPSSVDLLLGADIFWDLLCTNKIYLGKNSPVLQDTKFGYVISGPTGTTNIQTISCNFSQFDSIQEQLAKFWTIEELESSDKDASLNDNDLCENHFKQHMSRDADGRFSVGIPMKGDESTLGDSFQRAKLSFLSLEKRLQKQSTLKAMYIDFMNEYKNLGHMSESDINNLHTNSYFMPHHGVLREQSTTTKLRVVFNASAPSSSGVSSNDLQLIGPTIQSDLLSILLRFRQHRYVLAGDIEKMYRQVLINLNQRHLQQIVWRDDPFMPLKSYNLNTVTYGTASAPFLAVRCLKQLADECENADIGRIIREDFYVDDLITGCDTVEGLLQIRKQITQVLASGCFNLRKFKSNVSTCSDDSSAINNNGTVDFSEHEPSKTLGLIWSPSTDELLFNIKNYVPSNADVTKRVLLSTIAQIFDPLGLISIFTINGKNILQRLWLHKLNWDDPIPEDVLNSWSKFFKSLNQLNDLKIPRHVVCHNPQDIQFHIFCDASKDAYGACVYVRSVSTTGAVKVHLLCSKTRVSPIKPTSMPRLELCGASMAAKLLEKVLTTTRLPYSSCFLWTDSSVVLSWLKTQPNKLKQFVRNRVSDILERTKNYPWRHVPTASNPADLLSRGVGSNQPNKLNFWLNGPNFLLDNENNWPNKTFKYIESDLPEVVSAVALSAEPSERLPFSRFSNLLKLKNTCAYILRFINNCRKSKSDRLLGPLTLGEKQQAFNTLIKLSQFECFPEYYTIALGKPLPTKNKLLSLSPFVDDSGLLRVGGRIKNGNFSFDKKHPILITSTHPLTKLIFQSEHFRLMHAGPQLLLASIREQFWPLGGRNLAKSTVHKCHRCFRMKAQSTSPVMGNLPRQRLQPGYPFQTSGMDYAGPIIALNRKGRGCRTIKVYVAIFVCFATKGCHLELVTDLSKDSFLSALRRFIARRSRPSTLFSDNGTQFVGARNDLYKFLKSNSDSIVNSMSDEGIEFKFIPAYAPHMGGLWESGVRSFKSHLNRVLGNAHLDFEDLYTVLVQIEAILNSRPLTPLSNDPQDLTPLTPGHFLVGRPLTALPMPELLHIKEHRLTRFERLEQMRQHFWSRWHKEYIAELQQRTKWQTSKGLVLQEGTLALIKDEALPPMKWSLGRVIKVHPGSDGVSRVADLQTSKGVVRRAFNRICPLPGEDVNDS
ncbi:uncharacterized protein LOC123875994 [Maniola jurtina]|uniref:uncharacterized protein LOC123875994 n=1 Tax=Maniola jurtina TaxID=191418 RepID=UPI001E685DC3|nr:uncharacterized protein LOC123875994 [Maniola jurtina]